MIFILAYPGSKIDKTIFDRVPQCKTECFYSFDCKKDEICKHQGCSRVCLIEPLGFEDPMPVKPIVQPVSSKFCADECVTSVSCGSGYICAIDVSDVCKSRRCIKRSISGGIFGAMGARRQSQIDAIHQNGICEHLCFNSSDCLSNEMCTLKGCRKECIKIDRSSGYV